MVFASYAIASKALNRDDLSAIDLLNQVAVIVHGAPPGVTGALRDSLNSDRELGLQLARIALKQPSAIVILMTPDAMKLYRQLYPSLVRDGRSSAMQPPAFWGLLLPMILFVEARKCSRFLPKGWPEDDHSQPLDGVLSALIDVRRESFTAYNVIGRVPGTDPALKGSYVAYSAHYDHVGIVPPANGDSIANGADDDGSGTVALMELARLTARQPNKRSTLFIWHTAEEKGLLGSAWFAAHPTVPMDSIVGLLNVDMIGRNGSDSLFIIGPRAAPNGQSQRLGAIVDSVNGASGRPFIIDRSADDANHPEMLYQRSDHIHYAKRGVPVAFFTTGIHPDYHDVTDDMSRIDLSKLARVTGLLYDVGRAVGNDARRPR
jgi:hypothetical protein